MTIYSGDTFVAYKPSLDQEYATLAITNSEFMLDELTKYENLKDSSILTLPEITQSTIDDLLRQSLDKIGGSYVNNIKGSGIFSIVVTGTKKDIEDIYIQLAKTLDIYHNLGIADFEPVLQDQLYDQPDDVVAWMERQIASGIPASEIRIADYTPVF